MNVTDDRQTTDDLRQHKKINRRHSSKLVSFWENRVFCILATDRQTDGQTDGRHRCVKPQSRYRELRFNKKNKEYFIWCVGLPHPTKWQWPARSMAMVTNNNNNNNNNNHHHPIYKAPKALTSEALDELDYSQYDIDCVDKKTYFTTQLFLILTCSLYNIFLYCLCIA